MSPALAVWVLPAVLGVVSGCATLPRDAARTPSHALADTGSTRIGRAVATRAGEHPGATGVHALVRGRDAFAARVLLAAAAEKSLDVQYYIYRDDITGGLLSEALWKAAERGVRVRLLVDDNNTRGLDQAIAALAAHPNIEVRLFNPYANRGVRMGELVTSFERLNRRMHNKSFIADNQVAIVGGRNVGDEYFGADSPVEFADLDALVVGAVVPDVSAEFDAYWNSDSAYPARALIAPAGPDVREAVHAAWTRLHEKPEAASYLEALRVTPIVADLVAGTLELDWARAQVLADDPAKVLNPAERTELHMLPRLHAVLGAARRQLLLVSPYFVPTEAGTRELVAVAARGVDVRVLTNSLAATDVAPVHAGYARYREALLHGGVRLYELKPTADESPARGEPRHRGSSASLHAKTFGIDGARAFIGSFNFDPRSARLNTEMGVLIESADLAGRLARAFEADIPRLAYEVRLAPDGRSLQWIDGDGGATLDDEPGVGAGKRAWVWFLSLLPIEWLL
jgi:cardiolipin synthase C